MKRKNIWSRIRSAVASGASWTAATFSSWAGAYGSTDKSRKVFEGRARGGTSSQVLAGNLTELSAQGRQVERATPLGRAVHDGLVADVVGNGIDMLPDTGDPELDKKISERLQEWAMHALVNGRSLWAWQRIAMGEISTSGSGLARWLVLPDRIQKGWLPICLLPLDMEWMSETPCGEIASGNTFVRGKELDKYGREQFFHLRNPEYGIIEPGERVPADKIIHVFEQRRSQQYHGEPILVPAIERMLQDGRLIETELKAAVATSAPAIAIKTAQQPDDDEDGDPVTDIPAGATVRLLPGEDISSIQNNRPNQLIAPFRAGIRGDVAASCRTSQFHLDRDPSRANYSSMRLDQLVGKRLHIGLKETIGECGTLAVYFAVLPWILLELGVALPQDPRARTRLFKVKLRPDQPGYVDPAKEIEASTNAIHEGLSSLEAECSAQGKDWREIQEQLKVEQAEKDKRAVDRIVELQALCDAANKKNPALNLKWQDLAPEMAPQKPANTAAEASAKQQENMNSEEKNAA